MSRSTVAPTVVPSIVAGKDAMTCAFARSSFDGGLGSSRGGACDAGSGD